MHVAAWLVYALLTVVAWGVVGLLQKLSTNNISAESSLIWLVVGFLLIAPFFYTGPQLFHASKPNLAYGILSGLLNALGAWALFAALKNGGKASVVAPLTALYPVIVILVVPLILPEHITLLQWTGVGCALIAVVLLSDQEEPKVSLVEAAGVEPASETANNKERLHAQSRSSDFASYPQNGQGE